MLVSGPTGVGKSTLLGVVTGLVPRFTGGGSPATCCSTGRASCARRRATARTWSGTSARTRSPASSPTPSRRSWPTGWSSSASTPATMRRRVEETLDLLGIADLRIRDLRTLSGGQQQRVAIGSVLTMHPRVLVLDEPTSALDPTAAEDVLATLTRLVHDLGRRRCCSPSTGSSGWCRSPTGCACWPGTAGSRVGEPADLLEHSPVVPPIVELGRAGWWHPLPLTVREARRRAAVLDLGPPPARRARRRRPGAALTGRGPDRAPRPPRRAPRRRPHAAHRPGHRADGPQRLGQVDAAVGAPGRSAGVRSGSVAVDRADPAALEPARRRALVGLVPQTAADLLYLETVAEECAAADGGARAAAGRSSTGSCPASPTTSTRATCPRASGSRWCWRSCSPPSRSVLLLDEPTRGLDYPAKDALAGILRDARRRRARGARRDPRRGVRRPGRRRGRRARRGRGRLRRAGRRVVAESPAFAPQVTKILGAALAAGGRGRRDRLEAM